MIDIYGKISGVKRFKWIDERERKQGFSHFREWIIYSDEIVLPTHSFTSEEFYSETGENKFYNDFIQKIQRSMNPRMTVI
jgi:hypothetical protein